MLNFSELKRLITNNRASRYFEAAGNDEAKALELYLQSLILSGHCFALISFFEVIFRNKINNFISNQYAHQTNFWLKWIVDTGNPFDNAHEPDPSKKKNRKAKADILTAIEKTENTFIAKGINPNNISNDDVVPNLTLGFWCCLLRNNQFNALGKSLLAVFPNLPPDTSGAWGNRQIQLTKKPLEDKLYKITLLRNRIAHNEPICIKVIGGTNRVDFKKIDKLVEFIKEITDYMGEDAAIYDRFIDEINNKKPSA